MFRNIDEAIYRDKHSMISYKAFINYLKKEFKSVYHSSYIVDKLEYFGYSKENIKSILIDWLED